MSTDETTDSPSVPELHSAPPGRSFFADRSRWRSLVILLLAVFVFAFSYWDSSSELRTSPFHPDESRWINRAYYLQEALDPLGPAWSDRYLIRGQPPMGSYVIGAALLAQGRDLTTNGPWDFQFGFESNVTWNATRGNMPVEDDLIAARRANMAIGALTCVALFLIITQLTNLAGGVGGRSLHGGPPAASVPLDARRLGCGFHLFCGAFGAGRNVVGQTAVVVAGIAVQPGHGGWSIDEIKPAGPGGWHRARRSRAHTRPLAAKTAIHWQGVVVVSRSERGTERSLGWMLIVQPVLVAALFVTSYPYLWSAPIERTRILFDFRRFEMNNQAGSGRRRPLPRVWKPSSAPGRTSMTGPASDRIATAIGDALGQDWSGVRIDPTWRCPASCFSSTSPGGMGWPASMPSPR